MINILNLLINLRQATRNGDYQYLNGHLQLFINSLLDNFSKITTVKHKQLYVESLHFLLFFKTQKRCDDLLICFQNDLIILEPLKIVFPEQLDSIDGLMKRLATEHSIDLFQHYLYLDHYIHPKVFVSVSIPLVMSILGLERNLLGIELVELMKNHKYTFDFYEDAEDNIYYFQIVERVVENGHKQTNTLYKIAPLDSAINEDNCPFIQEVSREGFNLGVDEF